MLRSLIVVALLLGSSAWAADVSVSGRVTARDENKSIDVAFSAGDRALIQDYYRADKGGKERHGKKVPPGLAKKGGVPPGLAKHQRLPDHVEYELLPRDLEARLPPLASPNYVRVRIGQDFAILDKKTRVVFDVAVGLGN